MDPDLVIDENIENIYSEVTEQKDDVLYIEETYILESLDEKENIDTIEVSEITEALGDIDTIYDQNGNEVEVTNVDIEELADIILSKNNRANSDETAKVDIVFIVDTTTAMNSVMINVKNNVNALTKNLEEYNNIDANYALIEFRDSNLHGLDSTKLYTNIDSNWFTNATTFKMLIDALKTGGSSTYTSTPIDGLEIARTIDWREDATRMVVLVGYNSYRVGNSSGYTDLQMLRVALLDDGLIVSVVTTSSAKPMYALLSDFTGGIYQSISDSFYNQLFNLANNSAFNSDGEWVFLNDYQGVKLSEPLEYASTNDTDEDSLTDAEELGDYSIKPMEPFINELLTRQGLPKDAYIGKKTLLVWNYLSNPTKQDTDNDSLKDGMGITVNDKIVAPRDPFPKESEVMTRVWEKHINAAVNGKVATKLNPHYTDQIIDTREKVDQFLIDFATQNGLNIADLNITKNLIDLAIENSFVLDYPFVEQIAQSIRSEFHILLNFSETANEDLAELGSIVLNFRMDNLNQAYHSQPETWQRAYGYNDIYDKAFYVVSEIRVGKLYFTQEVEVSEEELGKNVDPTKVGEHIIWSWLGDYWNLGTGAEFGVYKYSHSVNDIEHYDAIDFNLPMTLGLYDDEKDPSHYFEWAPIDEQWWITGFDYKSINPNPDKLVAVVSIDFSGHEDMYNETKKAEFYKENKKLSAKEKLLEYSIYDDDNKTIWFMWYNR